MLIPSYLHTFAFVWTTKRTKMVIVTSMFTKMFSNLKQNFKHKQGNCHFLKINYLCVFSFSNILDFMYFFTGYLQKHVNERTDGRKTLNVYGIYKLNTFIKFLLNVSLFANITGNPNGFNENETRMRV